MNLYVQQATKFFHQVFWEENARSTPTTSKISCGTSLRSARDLQLLSGWRGWFWSNFWGSQNQQPSKMRQAQSQDVFSNGPQNLGLVKTTGHLKKMPNLVAIYEGQPAEVWSRHNTLDAEECEDPSADGTWGSEKLSIYRQQTSEYVAWVCLRRFGLLSLLDKPAFVGMSFFPRDWKANPWWSYRHQSWTRGHWSSMAAYGNDGKQMATKVDICLISACCSLLDNLLSPANYDSLEPLGRGEMAGFDLDRTIENRDACFGHQHFWFNILFDQRFFWSPLFDSVAKVLRYWFMFCFTAACGLCLAEVDGVDYRKNFSFLATAKWLWTKHGETANLHFQQEHPRDPLCGQVIFKDIWLSVEAIGGRERWRLWSTHPKAAFSTTTWLGLPYDLKTCTIYIHL